MKFSLFILVCLSIAGYATYGMAEGDKIITQREMNEIAKMQYDKSSQELNDLIGSIMKSLDNAGQDRLKKVEAVWTNYRDLHCAAVTYAYQEGSAYHLIKYSCLSQITEQRILVLKSAYQKR
jgi:uncharacterized protein YecT (DUF1311 family)